MQNQINIYGKKQVGKLELSNKEALLHWIKNLPDGEDIVIKFNISKSYKTLRQLRLVYSMFRTLSDKLGYSVEEIKTLMKIQQGLCAESEIEGQKLSFCKSLSDMSKIELSDFISKIDIWSFQRLGIKLLTNEDIIFLEDSK